MAMLADARKLRCSGTQVRFGAREILLGVDAGWKLVHAHGHADAITMLQRAQLFQRLGAFQRGRLKLRGMAQEAGAISVQTDMAQHWHVLRQAAAIMRQCVARPRHRRTAEIQGIALAFQAGIH